MTSPRLAVTVLLLTTALLSGCAGGTAASPTGTSTATSGADSTVVPPVAPVVRDVGDLQGATVQLVVGQVLDIDTGDLAVDSYSGEVADPDVATFDAGKVDAGATFNPGVTGLATGTTTVTLSNSNGGIQNVVFTVEVSAAG